MSYRAWPSEETLAAVPAGTVAQSCRSAKDEEEEHNNDDN